MKLQFSLVTLLVCITVLAVLAGVCARIQVHEPASVWDMRLSATDAIKSFHPEYSRSPTTSEIVIRSAIWGPLAIAGTLAVLWVVRA